MYSRPTNKLKIDISCATLRVIGILFSPSNLGGRGSDFYNIYLWQLLLHMFLLRLLVRKLDQTEGIMSYIQRQYFLKRLKHCLLKFWRYNHLKDLHKRTQKLFPLLIIRRSNQQLPDFNVWFNICVLRNFPFICESAVSLTPSYNP